MAQQKPRAAQPDLAKLSLVVRSNSPASFGHAAGPGGRTESQASAKLRIDGWWSADRGDGISLSDVTVSSLRPVAAKVLRFPNFPWSQEFQGL
ncbi:hypothetical protein VTJ49DRAFT_6715 [Mycothermus thermophilus]|uniref:Uncharacterized protein n=1 Tax=Humicola insolens TaxID=85995 RepID=A0ABR3VJJ9_HUMIN